VEDRLAEHRAIAERVDLGFGGARVMPERGLGPGRQQLVRPCPLGHHRPVLADAALQGDLEGVLHA
jgi:hypothetical protein